ncbi:MAG: 30S ribosomal protein S4 [Deltaproteobacteria bacterium]|nr:30S ribosomal protein S4 [Deltaproteobacteria bacterium]
MKCDHVCSQCRREGIKLFLKGDRCFTDKCAIERRAYAPGQHGQARKKISEYGQQLREKQKVKRMYGLREKQFRKTFHEAERQKGITGFNLLLLLERRLDNIICRIGLARSHREARKIVKHGHILVNGSVVSFPSYLVEKGDKIGVKEKSRKMKALLESVEGAERRGIPEWLRLEKEQLSGEVKDFPTREQLTMPIEEQLIVELYSK